MRGYREKRRQSGQGDGEGAREGRVGEGKMSRASSRRGDGEGRGRRALGEK